MNTITDVNGDQINPDRRYTVTLNNEGKKSFWRRYPQLSGKLTFNVNVVGIGGGDLVFDVGKRQTIHPFHCDRISPI